MFTFEEQVARYPKQADKVDAFLRQWEYDCARWDRYAIVDLDGTFGEKCKASRRVTNALCGR